jgi:hypothetical protein
MCSVSHFILTVLLFIALTPGVLVRFPRRGSLINAAVVHGILFAILSYLLYFGIQRMSEGFKEGGPPMAKKITIPTTTPPAPVISRGAISEIISSNTGKETLCNLLNAAATVQDTFSAAINDANGDSQKKGSLTADRLSKNGDAFYTYLSEVKTLIIYLNSNKSEFISTLNLSYNRIPIFFSDLGDTTLASTDLIKPNKYSKSPNNVIYSFFKDNNIQKNFYNLLKGEDAASLKHFISKLKNKC